MRTRWMLVGMCLLLGAPLQGQERPEWVEAWLRDPLPRGSEESNHRDLFAHDVMPAWKTANARPLRFELVDAASGRPLVGALLSSWQGRQHAFTDGEGRAGPLPWYASSRGEPVQAWVMATAPGYVTGSSWVQVAGDRVRVALAPDRGRRLAGRVRGPDGRPLANCRVGVLGESIADPTSWTRFPTQRGASPAWPGAEGVMVLSDQAGGPRFQTSDEDGRFVFKGVPGKGQVRLVAAIPGVGAAELPCELGSVPPALELRLDPQRGEVIAGVIRGPDGGPLAGVEVRDFHTGASRQSDAEGRFRFPGCVPELAEFELSAPGVEGEVLDPRAERSQGKDLANLELQLAPGRRDPDEEDEEDGDPDEMAPEGGEGD